jgi:molybdenum cofactor cytidylyltransferase
LICLIILAAGFSKRFGRNKMLEKIGCSTIIERVVKSGVSSKADEVIVVLGHDAEKIRDEIKNFACRLVFNKDYEKGQSYSVKKGVNLVKDYAEAVMILPGDVALITPNSINMVVEEYRKCKSPIVVASHQGRLGHPILFDRSLLKEIMEINEETNGLKAVINRHKDSIRKVETYSAEVLIDIDTEEDLKKALQQEEAKCQ